MANTEQSDPKMPGLGDPSAADIHKAEEIIKTLAGLLENNPAATRFAAHFVKQAEENSPAGEVSPSLDARYRTLVEQIPAIIFMAFLDRAASEAYVNPHIESVLGFSQREWLDDPVRWYRHIHPEDKERWSLEAAQMLITGDPLRSVYRVLARDGRVVWFQCEAKMVRDKRGRPWFIHGLAVDISELRETQARLEKSHEEARNRAEELERVNQKLKLQIAEREAAEKKLRESEENFRLLVEGVRDYGLFLLDPQGRVVSWNQGAERLKGWSADEIIGQHFSKFFLPEDIQKDLPVQELAVARVEGRYAGEGWRVRKNGSKFWANVLITALRDRNGRLYGFAKLTRDISEQKLMQDKLQESERLAAMGTTAAVFAHEIGNPLNGISSALQFLQLQLAEKDPAVRPAASLDAVMQEVNRLAALLDDFRSLARPNRLNLAPIGLAQLVGELLSSQAAEYEKRGIIIKRDFPPDLPVVMADSRRLKQAVLNLCKNAVEAMPDGGVLSIRGRCSAGLVLLEIADTGVGITEESDIFQLFHTTKEHGTGLGLAIVRQAISAHDGMLHYRSEPGKGTTFTVSLPA